MRVELTSSGGIAYFPGLNRPVVLDTEALASEEAAELRRLVGAASFFALPANLASAPRPDAQSHVLRIEEEGRAHVVRLSDPIADPALAALVTFVRKHAPGRRG